MATEDEMETKEAIYSRRAVRQYTGQLVDDSTIRSLIEAATQAPSAINQQPWAFVVLQDQDLLDRISAKSQQLIQAGPEYSHLPHELREPIDSGEFDIFYGAGTLIVICVREDAPHGDWDCCFAAQNLMVAARAMGLGTCPIGFAWGALDLPEVREEIGIPKGYRAVLPMIVGHPVAFPPNPGRRSPEILNWVRPRLVATV